MGDQVSGKLLVLAAGRHVRGGVRLYQLHETSLIALQSELNYRTEICLINIGREGSLYSGTEGYYRLHDQILLFRKGDKLHFQQPLHSQQQQGENDIDLTSLTEEQLLKHYYTELAKETNHNRVEIGKRAGLKKTAAQNRYKKFCKP
jgi:hypothetical protein